MLFWNQLFANFSKFNVLAAQVFRIGLYHQWGRAYL